MKTLLATVSVVGLMAIAQAPAFAQTQISTQQFITPTAATGSIFTTLNPGLPSPDNTYVVGQAVSTAVSPDGKTLLVLTSGYNDDPDPATQSEFVFVFDISTGAPVQLQALPIPNAFCGVTWAPSGAAFYVAGGQDDNVHTFAKSNGLWAETGTPITLNHTEFGVPQPAGNGLFSIPGLGVGVGPLASGLATTANGALLVVANLENDSISVINTATRAKIAEIDLRPGRNVAAESGVPGGEFPFSVAIIGTNAYVTSLRDREIVVVSLTGTTIPPVTARIPVQGNPNKIVANKAGTRLFVTADNSDKLFIIDPATNAIVGKTDTLATALIGSDSSNGNAPNNLVLSPDEKTAYVTNAGTNSVSVIDVSTNHPVVKGMFPTGWYPNAVATSADGSMLYVVNGKSLTGPIPSTTYPSENYDEELLKAGFLTLPTPGPVELIDLTAQVASNTGVGRVPDPGEAATFSFLHGKIQHIIYIVKENRTYDQILGDLTDSQGNPLGNGDPTLTMYGQALTPNFHAIASGFVDLDNFFDSGEISMNGWQWSTTGRGNDLNEKVGPVNYGKGGGSYDSEGLSRDINVGLKTREQRAAQDLVYALQAVHDPDLLPGDVNEVAPDGPAGQVGAGFIWNAAMRAHLSVRNYGFLEDLVPYSAPVSYDGIPLGGIPPICDAYATKTRQGFPAEASLIGKTDEYFRGFDNQVPDFCRYLEWSREFETFENSGKLPSFETVRFMHDHTGNFGTALYGVNTAELQQADNDYAVGLLVDRIAHSVYATNTLIFVIEDDSQAGEDHVDSHRSTAYVVGPYVKQGAVVSTRYSTVNMLRTMEDILGLEHLSLHDANAAPMTDIFDIALDPTAWSYSAAPAAALLTTTLPILGARPELKHAALSWKPLHDAAWWTENSKGFHFEREDMNDEDAYNRFLWLGTMGDKPYPTTRSGIDYDKAPRQSTSLSTGN